MTERTLTHKYYVENNYLKEIKNRMGYFMTKETIKKFLVNYDYYTGDLTSI